MSLTETPGPAIDVVSFGCRLNACESEIVAREAGLAGVKDVVVVNTCAVTNEAVAQARQTIRKLRREQPARKIVVTGCAAQIQPQMFAAMVEVDRVIGNDDKLRTETWSRTRSALDSGHANDDKIAVSDIMAAVSRPAAAVASPARPRAYVQIQNGCDHRCTFCIIPFGRGNSRSVAPDEIVGQVRRLVEAGNGEIVLTGVDLTSYGADLDGAATLGALVKRLLREVPELKRLRLSSIDSIEVDRDLFDAIAREERLMPHLHLSLQSGDDLILKRMKRRHARNDAIRFCAQVRSLRPDITFGADIIAGFPTETEDMFRRSLDLVECCDLTFVHAFPYSLRPGTPAARMPQVASPLIKERARRLREVGNRALQWRLAAEVGAQRDVLIENPSRGRTEHFLPVTVRGETPGAVRQMTISGEDGQCLLV
jgi:threonylcarbamoyladenosine tRNA methylthiotransferase MtaB